ncbi:site-specific DNA-methyltransferase (adenine-specific) [Spirochaetia bacterium]|nr:site-specific DNA-methyltransferase (adenine-specific) [Spirochaetia bacterium]
MRYIGSKANLLQNIKSVIDHCCGNENKAFCDLFCGTGAVSRFFKPYYQITSNDILYFSHIITSASIENNDQPSFPKLKKIGIVDPITYLETTKIKKTDNFFITNTYSPYNNNSRMYFTEENAMRIDFIRKQIEDWNSKKLLNKSEYKYLLAGLIEGVPFISNITGTYGAYLKHWDKRAFKQFEMIRLQIIDNGYRNICFNEDAADLIKKISGDILYLDPPYNSRQYLPNYHVLETIAKYDNPKVKGITGVRPYQGLKSDYCIKSNAQDAFENLIKEAEFKHIIVSYSDDGIIKSKAIKNILKEHCSASSVKLKSLPYKRYKGKIQQEETEHYEYIFYAKKENKSIVYDFKNSPEYLGEVASPQPLYSANGRRRFVKSPMNYIGGKYKILPQLFEFFPNNINTFIDLFAGGFNITANIASSKTICNDMNYKVVEMVRMFQYADINSVLRRIYEKINEYQLSKDNEKGFKAFRDYYNKTGNPIDLFTLSCFSFNYQFRFNNQLEYNNPFGRNRSCFSETTKANLIMFMKEIKQKDIEYFTRDFREINFNTMGNGDFIYCDPPYLITTGSYNDGNRGFHDWGEAEEKDLYSLLDDLNKKNVCFALSNVLYHKNTENKILFDWSKKYTVHKINKNYSNCNYQVKDKESKTLEVLITNY